MKSELEQEVFPLVTIDARCGCHACRERTEDIYRMIGQCYNCQAGPFLLLFRAGDRTRSLDCPACGCTHTVHVIRRAENNETPAVGQP